MSASKNQLKLQIVIYVIEKKKIKHIKIKLGCCFSNAASALLI